MKTELGGAAMDNNELSPLIAVGKPKAGNAYTNALVKRVVFSNQVLAAQWADRIQALEELRLSRRYTPAPV